MRKLLALLAVLAIGLGFAQSNNAMVRVAHLSPDAPAVDVWVNGARALQNVPFKAVSNYLSLPAGEITVWVVPAGATTPRVIDAKATIAAGKMYTIAATGLLNATGNQPKLGPTIIEDVLPTLAAGQAGIRVVHTSPTAPAVDVAIRGGAVVVPNLAFPKASGYLTVPAGSYNFDVRAAGTTTVALPLNNVALEAGKVYTVFAVGGTTAQPLSVVVAVDK
ncbi:MAG: DUF4397 domain-containing protein [Meiothermus sp.]|uniref:DUF4397 domain-containing protein n=1 Tax=Meiothermus sp. TaxID=1955249 RepID=UPI0025D5B404|nr:DUF4397 domain-containing protein [Meiothermus sp.]MCS7067045.1 DUF4397 domain-containing protein [Meiothermus sp.]MCX7600784.1 DUF4397 domain-containing protein [Meiothermus sp.]MDW8424544.1 DUF4397 domain-containing protein [Meiothermus sp.]